LKSQEIINSELGTKFTDDQTNGRVFMKRFLMTCILLLGFLLLLACGKTTEEKLIGTWEATMEGETMIVEFYDDGMVQAENEDIQRWALEEGDPAIVRLYDIEDGDLEVELEVVFDGNDKVTLSGPAGRRITMERAE